jgi:DNA-binding MarR family transcriptional regulator
VPGLFGLRIEHDKEATMAKLWHQTPTRWRVLQSLLVDGTADRKELAERTGLAPATMIDCLKRPIKAGWVRVTQVQRPGSPGIKYLYTITPLGRQALGIQGAPVPLPELRHEQPTLRNLSKLRVLQLLGDSGPMNVNELAVLTGVSVQSVRNALRNPVDRGWVARARTKSPNNLPGKLEYSLTDKGRAALAGHLALTEKESS